KHAPMLMVEVVLPTPPFWLHMEITVAGPFFSSSGGCGIVRSGLPVKPRFGSSASKRPSLLTFYSLLHYQHSTRNSNTKLHVCHLTLRYSLLVYPTRHIVARRSTLQARLTYVNLAPDRQSSVVSMPITYYCYILFSHLLSTRTDLAYGDYSPCG